MPSVLLAAMVVFMTSSGWPSVVTSNKFNPLPSSRLENLTGFFSSLPVLPVAVDMLCAGARRGMAGPRQMDGFFA